MMMLWDGNISHITGSFVEPTDGRLFQTQSVSDADL